MSAGDQIFLVVFKILLLRRSLFPRSFVGIMMYLVVFAIKICFFFVSKINKQKTIIQDNHFLNPRINGPGYFVAHFQ